MARPLTRFRSPHDRAIAALAVPALGTLVAEPIYVLADTAIIGNVGTAELAGLALASTILLTAHALLIFLAYGTTGPVARLIGAGREPEAAERSLQGLWLALFLGVVTAVVIAVAKGPLLDIFGADDEVLGHADRYLSISLFGLPAMLLTLAAGGAFHGRQNTRTPLILAVTGALLNLVVESVLIFGMGYGVGASAASTVFAQVTTTAAAVVLLLGWIRPLARSLRPDPTVIGRIFLAGQALVLRTAALRGSFTLSVVVASRMGSAEVAAHQIALQIWGTLALALDAVAIAGQALTGRWLGTGDTSEAKAVTRRMIEVDVGVGALAGLILIVLRGPIASLFSSDPDVIGLVTGVLVLVALQQPLNGHVFALDGILMGASDLNYLAATMVLSAALFVGAAAVLLAVGGTLVWLWGAIFVLMASRAVFLQRRWASGRWLEAGGSLG